MTVDFVEANRLLAVVLEHEVVGLLVDEDLRAGQDLPDPLVVLVQLYFDDRERIVHRARLVARLPEADRPIRAEHDAAAALLELALTRVAQVPSERLCPRM